MNDDMTTESDIETAERLLAKVRSFVAGLDDEERRLFAALIGPGVSSAHRSTGSTGQPGPAAATGGRPDPHGERDTDVPGRDWSRLDLPEHLARVIRRDGVRIVGL